MIRVLAFLEADHVTGPAKNLLDFHGQLRQQGNPVQLEIVTFCRGRAACPNDLTRAVETAGIPLHCIGEGFPFDPRILPGIRQLLHQLQPSIVQTHSIKSHFLVGLLGEWKRRPWLAFHHGYTLARKRLRLFNRLDRWSLPRACRVVTVSRAFERDLVSRGVSAGRITVLHNAIDPDWGDRARDPGLRLRTRESLGLTGRDKAILIVGRLSREKSHVLLVEAFARLRTLAPAIPARLLILGDGPELAAIERTARALDCLPQVSLLGRSADVLPYYAAADLAVLASKSEGSPNALLEAMAARVPVVATAVGGVPEIVTHGETALLVPPSDAGALADALAQALGRDEEARAMAERAHALILAQYTPKRRCRTLCEIYRQTVDLWPKGSTS